MVSTILEGARRRFQVAVAETGRLDARPARRAGVRRGVGVGHPHRRADRLGRAVRVVVPRDRGRRRRPRVAGGRPVVNPAVGAPQRPAVPANRPAQHAAPADRRRGARATSTTSGSTCVTVTAVDVDSDLNRAIVYYDSLQGADGDAEVLEALGESRPRLRTGRRQRGSASSGCPSSMFTPDPAVRAGSHIEEMLAEIGPIRDDVPIPDQDDDRSEDARRSQVGCRPRSDARADGRRRAARAPAGRRAAPRRAGRGRQGRGLDVATTWRPRPGASCATARSATRARSIPTPPACCCWAWAGPPAC